MGVVAPADADLEALVAAAPRREVSPLQTYVETRLDGGAGPAWLDGQDVEQASKTCEMLGAALLFGVDASVRAAVELRLCEICGRFPQYLIGLPQLAVLTLQRLDPVPLLARHSVPGSSVYLGLDHPAAQALPAASALRGNRPDRSRPVRMTSFIRQNHPDRSFAGLRQVAVRSRVFFHRLHPYSLWGLRRNRGGSSASRARMASARSESAPSAVPAEVIGAGLKRT